jgi:hypothetical protein
MTESHFPPLWWIPRRIPRSKERHKRRIGYKDPLPLEGPDSPWERGGFGNTFFERHGPHIYKCVCVKLGPGPSCIMYALTHSCVFLHLCVRPLSIGELECADGAIKKKKNRVLAWWK